MKILLFAPRTDLLYADAEVQSILRSGNEVTPVLGSVNRQQFLDEVLRSDADLLWICSHGNEDGILLSDDILPAARLTQAARGRFSTVVLNTCNSFKTAQMLQNDTEAEIVATIVETPDEEAFYTGALFAHYLARTGDTAMAYDLAKPGGNRTYVRLAGKKK